MKWEIKPGRVGTNEARITTSEGKTVADVKIVMGSDLNLMQCAPELLKALKDAELALFMGKKIKAGERMELRSRFLKIIARAEGK